MSVSSILYYIKYFKLIRINYVLAITSRAKKQFFRLMKKIPYVKRKIDAEMEKINSDFTTSVLERTKNTKYIITLPTKGITSEDILKHLNENLELGNYINQKCLI